MSSDELQRRLNALNDRMSHMMRSNAAQSGMYMQASNYRDQITEELQMRALRDDIPEELPSLIVGEDDRSANPFKDKPVDKRHNPFKRELLKRQDDN